MVSVTSGQTQLSDPNAPWNRLPCVSAPVQERLWKVGCTLHTPPSPTSWEVEKENLYKGLAWRWVTVLLLLELYPCPLKKHIHFLKSFSDSSEARLAQQLKDEYIESDSAMILQRFW